MANDFSQKVDIFFEDIVNGFDATNITAKNVAQYKANSGTLAEGGQTFYRPMPMMATGADGRDVSSAKEGITELTVPSTLTDAHLRNVTFDFTGVDLNNPHTLERFVKATNQKLSNKIDVMVANAIAEKGTLAVVNSGNIDSYDDAAEADAIMLEQQATMGMRKMFLNPRMAKNLAGDLAARQTLTGKALSAYERSLLPPIAGFETFRTDYGKTITGSSGSGYLIDGANQDLTPTAKDANGLPVDNRTQTLTVKTGTNAAVGDAFTIADVYSVGHINKESTGQLKTFRITAINGADWTISPAIIPADGSDDSQKQYANVNTVGADGAAITILNTVTKPSSVFCEEGAVEIIHADYSTDAFSATGKKVRKASTDSGIQIVMLSDSDVETLTATYRLFIWANVEVLQPEQAGIMLEGQT